MKHSLSQQNKSKPSIEYSYEWFNLFLDSDLQELYQVFLRSNHWDKEAFFTDLSIHLLPLFEVSYDQIQHPAEHYTYSYIEGKATAKLINELDKDDLAPLYINMIPVYQELYFNQVKKRIKEGRKTDSLNITRSNARNLLEDVFNRLINISALLLESIVIDNDIYRYANPKTVLFDIIKESINKETFSVHTFSLASGSPEHFIDKVHEIAIKHTVLVLDRLPNEEKVALIPSLKQHMKNEQNLKVTKGLNYNKIGRLEDFYKLYIERFENEKKEIIELNKSFFAIGTMSDLKAKNPKDLIKKKEIIFKNIFIRLKHKFDNRPTAAYFESLFNSDLEYYETFNWVGDYSEFIILIRFLKDKGIIRQTNLQNVLTNRFLVKGEKLINKSSLSSQISQIIINPKSNWVKTLESCLY
jgi:hypothetical protein